MKSLDSDTESETFESAAESLDEDEEEERSKNTEKQKSFGESVKDREPVLSHSDTFDDVSQVEAEDTSNSSLMYRKRPERVKRWSSRSPTRVSLSKKTSGKESIFKHEMSPDILLQDITSNLTKNINKGLNTIQKKSSDVKDLILNSLPVGSVDEKENKFSYDENVSESPVDVNASDKFNKLSRNESSLDNFHLDDIREVPFKLEEKVVNTEMFDEQEVKTQNNLLKKNLSVLSKTDLFSNEDKKEVTQVTTCTEKNFNNFVKENICEAQTEMEDVKPFNEVKGKITENCELIDSVNKNVSVKPEEADFLCKELKEEAEKINNKTHKNVFQPFLQKEAAEITQSLEGQNKSKKTHKNENFKSYSSTNEEKASIERESKVQETSNVSKNEKSREKKFSENESKGNNIHNKKFIQPSLNNNQSDELSNLIDLPGNDESLIRNEWDNFSGASKNADSECVLEELKTALKKLAPEETVINQKKEDDLVLKDRILAVGSIQAEKGSEVGESTNEGWDDIDYNDDELGVLDSENPVQSAFKKEKVEFDCKKEKIDLAKSSDVKITDKSNAALSRDCTDMNFEDKEIHVLKTKQVKETITHEIKETEMNEEATEIDTQSNDDWDWDCWNETTQSKDNILDEIEKNTAAEPITKNVSSSEQKLKENDLFNDSKWSGWDTFGQKQLENQGNWSIGSWGVNILLNKATAVTQGISNVLEAGLGAPDPETLARMEKLKKEKIIGKQEINVIKEKPSEELPKKGSLTDVTLFPVMGITNLVAGVTSKIVEHSKIQEIGSKVITGGLDTLETFGKKTMEVLQEGDPGLKNKRALLLGTNKSVLSQVLREAREKADAELKKVEEKEMAKKCHFECLFDDFQGMVHLEALEMLSRQCELKLEQIRSSMTEEEQEDLDGILEEVEQLCSLDDSNSDSSSIIDFKISINMAVEPLKNEISVQQILQIHECVEKWLQASFETASLTIAHQKIVSTLAELTAATVHQFHKAGELLSVKECRKTVEEIDALSRMSGILCKEVNQICERFNNFSLNKSDKEFLGKLEVVKENSKSYIKQAFNLLIPVIQIGAAA